MRKLYLQRMLRKFVPQSIKLFACELIVCYITLSSQYVYPHYIIEIVQIQGNNVMWKIVLFFFIPCNTSGQDKFFSLMEELIFRRNTIDVNHCSFQYSLIDVSNYNHATSNLAIYSHETSQDKLSEA